MVIVRSKKKSQRKRKKYCRNYHVVIFVFVCLICCLSLTLILLFKLEGNERFDFRSPHEILNVFNRTRRKEYFNSSEYSHIRQSRSFEKLPDHCVQSSGVRELVIKGERHTGTNWLHKIVSSNIRDVEVRMDSPEFGWKHGFLPSKGWGKPLPENVILVVTTRDVFTWLPKMHKISYEPFMDRKRHLGFSSFIRAKYTGSLQPRNNPNEENIYEFNFRRRHKHRYAETADNIIKIREEKYKQWLNDDPSKQSFQGSKESFLKNRIHIRLESISGDRAHDKHVEKSKKGKIESQYQLIGKELLERCVSVLLKKDFYEVSEYTKFKERNIKKIKEFNVEEERKKLLETYTKDDLRFVLSQLDLAFEKQIGYDYSYINEILNEDAET